MHPSSRWSIAFLMVALSLGCSARGGGGGGGGTPDDAQAEGDAVVMPPDLGTGLDATGVMDRGVPIDNGVAPFDLGKPPADLGLPPIDLGLPPDVGPAPFCGDARCNGTENCMTCESDCGRCAATCGDGSCGGGETCTTCPSDCGACPARCGDSACNGGETCTTCPGDCGACPANCATLGSCGACVADTRCGWCPFDGCQPGTSSGPSGTSTCSIFPGWTRSAAACAVDAGVRDTGVDSGTAPSITASCVGTSTGLTAQCGWRFARTMTCSAGSSILVGCTGGADAGSGSAACGSRIGSCTGDPMMRVCAGSGPCATGLTISGTVTNAADDGCGLCPLGRFTCPSSGTVTIYERPYDSSTSASCTVSYAL